MVIQAFFNKRKISSKQLKLSPSLIIKIIRKRRKNKPKSSRRKEITKIREEINKIEIKK